MFLSGGLIDNIRHPGACSTNAADALAAVRSLVFQKGSEQPLELLAALEADFDDNQELLAALQVGPKIGKYS